VEYLEGCELSGAEHLRHPLLMPLYAQQVLVQFLETGVSYAELRGSTEGYVNEEIGLSFEKAVSLFLDSFRGGQTVLADLYSHGKSDRESWCAGVLGSRFSYKRVAELLQPRVGLKRRLPPKVNLLFVGKRHKTTRQMIREVAACAILRPATTRTGRTSGRMNSSNEFLKRWMSSSDVVGFDLAGKEAGNPPGRFAAEFRQLSKLHIPLTVHAGENASAQFVEDAILELGARRIGHGLSLIEDPDLMLRVREARIGIELCPLSNHQTSHFSAEGGRPYPLRAYLDEGIFVSLNTDNPIISGTDINREYFEASWAYGGDGLSLWDALRIVRMGYVQAFMGLPERRAMIEVVEQCLLDLLSEPGTIALLRSLADQQAAGRSSC